MGSKLSLASPADRASDAAEDVSDCLFPLRFTPFEFYFLVEDRPDFPGVIPIKLECRGHLDRAALEQAYGLTHARHPMLSARVEPDRKGWPYWVAGSPEPIHWADGASGHCQWRRSPGQGMQLEVCEEDDQIRFLFAFRHVAVDGLGGAFSVHRRPVRGLRAFVHRQCRTHRRGEDWTESACATVMGISSSAVG